MLLEDEKLSCSLNYLLITFFNILSKKTDAKI